MIPTERVDIAIVGGGIAGLAAAYELHRRGARFLLLEASSRLGGVIQTEQLDGFVIDAGPDSLLVQKPAAVELCRELGLGGRLVPTKMPRAAFVLRRGRLRRLPEASMLGIPTRLSTLAGTSLFSIPGKLRMAAEILVPSRRDSGDESVGAFIRRRFGCEAAAYLGQPLLAGIHAGDADRLSMRALFPRLVEVERTHGSVIRAFRQLPSAPPVDGMFRSLPGGLGEMVDVLIATLPPHALRLRAHVSSLEASNGFRLGLDDGRVVDAGVVILATPAFVTADLIEALAPIAAERCRGIRYSSTVTVALGYRRDAIAHPLEGSGYVVPTVERSPVIAVTWVSSKWPNRAPAGRVLLRAFLGGPDAPSLIGRRDEELIHLAHEELDSVLGIREQPILSRCYRWHRGTAQHEVGHLERLADIERALARWPGLMLTGSGFRGVGIPDCIADARAVAAAAADLASDRVT